MSRSRQHNRVLPTLVFCSLLLILPFLVMRVTAAAQPHEAPQTAIIPATFDLPQGISFKVRHEYGTYRLVEFNPAVWEALPADLRSRLLPTGDLNRLVINGRALDTSQAGPPGQRTPAAGSGKALHLIQFSGPLQDAWLAAVVGTGADPVHYVAGNGYLVWADAAARRRLDDMAAGSDFLQFSAPYTSAMKHHTTRLDTAADQEIRVTIQMLRHTEQRQTEGHIAALAVRMLTPWEPIMDFQNATAVVHSADIPQIAALPDVVVVEPYEPPQLLDEKQTQTLAGNLTPDGSGPATPGYLAWLQARGFSQNPADYPILDIVDDGIGNGLAGEAGGDVTFRVGGLSAGASRLAYISSCTGTGDGSGLEGHGHLNASIAGGFDARAGWPYRDGAGYQYGLGVNPYGRLAGTRVFNGRYFDLSGCGDSEQELIRRSYMQGARIVSNSWGCPGCAGSYTLSTQLYDMSTRDVDAAAPGDQALLAIFSAGNSGNTPATIGTPGDGKNVLTVGAVENQRPFWIDACGYGGEEADNVQDIAGYSSRGPASGGRVKPDLVAPGTHVTGTASTSPFYDGYGICDMYYPEGQQLFASSTGTSHSAPAVAGAASLATWWLENKMSIPNPSPALIKAFLLANTSHLTGSEAGDDLPSTNQGYGLLNLGSAFGTTPRLAFDQTEGRLFDQSGEMWSQMVHTAVFSEPLKIVLTYTDQPGLVCEYDDAGCAPQVNDLDLLVRAGDKTYYGNHLSGAWSIPGGAPDKLNNVEAIFLPPGTAERVTIEVLGFNIAGDGVPNSGDGTDQDFALVCMNCRADPPEDEPSRTYLPVIGINFAR
jgi:hypothetical protein